MSNNGELISVIITTHGRSSRLKDAIESVLKQTYNDIEIIVVDDNSDLPNERLKTERIVKKYGCIRLLENTRNLGGAESRNVGIRAAKGDLISFLDDDDQFLPEKLEKLYAIMKKHMRDKVGLVYCSCDAINENGVKLREYVENKEGRPFYSHMLKCVAATSLWLVPKSVLGEVGNFDDVPCKQDSTLILKILVAGYNVFGTTEKLVLYLEHNGDRISGCKESNARGICIYREKCRKQYYRLTKKEISDVESKFSSDLITIYLVNNDLRKAKNELTNIRRVAFFSKRHMKNIVKVLFRKRYLVSLSKKVNG